jgi:hypothetical protein
MDAYIPEETSTWLSLLNKLGNTRQRFDIYSSLYVDAAFQKDEDGDIDWNDSNLNLNFYFPLKIRINDYFSVPVYASYFGTDLMSNKQQDEDLQESEPGDMLFGAGAGLIFTSKFGTLAGLAGFKMQMNNRDYSNDDSNTAPVVYFVPVFNTSAYPLIGLLFRTVGGYVGLKDNALANYSVSLVSQTVDFGFMQIDSIDLYHNSIKYKFDAEAKNYGGRLTLLFFNTIGFGIDGGYRSYFNAADTAAGYTDGWFAKLIYLIASPGMRSSLYASFDASYYPLPKFGLASNFNLFGLQEAMFMELGFPEDRFEFTLGGRIYIDYGAFTGRQ